MNLLRWLALGLLAASMPVLAPAQENWTPGYIITHNGQTLGGQLDYRDWEANPRRVQFRKSPSDTPQWYGPSSIKAFGAAGKEYVGVVTTIDYSPFKVGELTRNPEAYQIQDSVFLTRLLQGRVNLYYLKDDADKDHFFLQNDTILTELRRVKYLVEYNRQDKIVQKDIYKGQLLYFFGDCPSLDKPISLLSYSTTAMIGIFQRYAECRGESYAVVKKSKKDKFKVKAGASLGASSTGLKVSSDFDYDVVLGTWDERSLKPAAGLWFSVHAPRNFGRFSWYNEFLYKAHRFQDKFETEPPTPDRYRTVDMRLDFGYLKWTSMVRYQHITPKRLQPFLQLGITRAFASFRYAPVKTVERKFFSSYEKTTSPAVDSGGSRIESGWAIGAGLAGWRKMGLELRYEQGDGFYSLVDITTRTNTFYLLLTYQFTP